jgi:hypothetical protein
MPVIEFGQNGGGRVVENGDLSSTPCACHEWKVRSRT